MRGFQKKSVKEQNQHSTAPLETHKKQKNITLLLTTENKEHCTDTDCSTTVERCDLRMALHEITSFKIMVLPKGNLTVLGKYLHHMCEQIGCENWKITINDANLLRTMKLV